MAYSNVGFFYMGNGKMKLIYTTQFGAFPLRFVHKNNDVYVSKSDLIRIFYDFFPNDYKVFVDRIISGIPDIIGDKNDVRSGILGKNEIGPIIHFHAVGNFLVSYRELIDVDREIIREAAFKISTFTDWYIATLSQVDEYFGRTIEDLFMSVKQRLDRINPPYFVEVMYDVEDNIPSWIGTCDKLRLVTEGRTYEELQKRVWEIAPEMHELHGYGKESDNIRISFVQTESHNEHQCLEM
ncbi:DUF1902 domain-containing protein [Histophilus somni]|uniref:DUF1902 domain-containing protein n=2 Tax=Histophilus somni TaxID=731 RepID=UPI0009D652FC|nr:DUF1902 domain-containing protein [Histophilus somni]QQF72646.1 DUF1902 domain-containing protein [Histophilus somni]QQF76784.1 DUF1902 domain-containing protein [Histophilus somni]QQF85777.1 DUF1902 domain-containing protein [Histophilus somni]QQF90692.1 DUF1902 domain-containing protein [Histophilus somni]QQJ90411.1 DUF1902 domain-containing protein [Histophilus somni]